MMRTTRVEKKQKRKKYVKNLLWTFLVIIPVAAVSSSFVLHYALNKDQEVSLPITIIQPTPKESNTFKYSYDTDSKEFYRVEIKKYDKYEDAEAEIISIKNKKLNGFIIKEQGYLVSYGIYLNKSQADTAAKYLKRKGIQSTVNTITTNSYDIKYNDGDKTLIDLVKATDGAILKIAGDKAALSLESLYSDKKIGGQSLDAIVENEAKLERYLNYLKTVEPSESNMHIKAELEVLIKEVLVDRLSMEDSYGYYDLQNNVLYQLEVLRKFYDKLTV